MLKIHHFESFQTRSNKKYIIDCIIKCNKFKIKREIFPYIVIIIISVVIFYKLYSWKIYINYASTDSSTHLMMVKDFLKYKTIFYKNPIYNALGYPFLAYTNIALFSIFFNLEIYKYFIVFNTIIFVCTAILFYDLLKLIIKNKEISILGTFFFLFSFFLNILIFGFISQLFSIPIIILLLKEIIMHEKQKKNKRKFLFICKMILLLISIQTSYYYYIPEILLGILIYIILKRNVRKREIVYSIVLYFIFFVSYNFYTSTHLSLKYESLINSEGYIYRDLYSSFLIFVPMILYYITLYYTKIDLIFSLFMSGSIFSLGLLILGINGKASSYYYFKNYVYLSIFIVIISCKILRKLKDMDKNLYKSILIFYFIILIMFLKGDEYIFNKNNLFNPEMFTRKNSVYLENYLRIKNKDYTFNEKEMKLIEYIKKK